jgi:hypothetical protein
MSLRFARRRGWMFGSIPSASLLLSISIVNGCGGRHRLQGDEFFVAVEARWPYAMTRGVDTCVGSIGVFESLDHLYVEYPSASFVGCVWGAWEDELERDVSTVELPAGCWMRLDALVPGCSEFCDGGWASFVTSRDRSGLGRSGVMRNDVSVRRLEE